MVAGRPFDETDAAGGDLVMIVSVTLAKQAWPGLDPVGRRVICCEGSPEDPQWKRSSAWPLERGEFDEFSVLAYRLIHRE